VFDIAANIVTVNDVGGVLQLRAKRRGFPNRIKDWNENVGAQSCWRVTTMIRREGHNIVKSFDVDLRRVVPFKRDNLLIVKKIRHTA